MRRFLPALCLLIGIGLVMGPIDVDAKRKKRKRRRALRAKKRVASQATKVAIEKLMGKYKWGMTHAQVYDLLRSEVRAIYKPKLKKASKDALLYDRLRREMMAEIKKVNKSKVLFEGVKKGARAGWSTSLIEREFAHKNNESMMVRWGQRDRRFYFFHHDRLWKVFIAFNADSFRGKSFQDFAAVMEKKFGKPEPKWRVNRTGKSEMSHLEWPPSDATVLRAVDYTAFYGNFCLVLVDKESVGRVHEGRKMNSPKSGDGDAMVEAVLSADKSSRDVNADVVDWITGRSIDTPGADISRGESDLSNAAASSSSDDEEEDDPAPKKKKKKRKINADDPLDGLDL